jgi:hypothetical protein
VFSLAVPRRRVVLDCASWLCSSCCSARLPAPAPPPAQPSPATGRSTRGPGPRRQTPRAGGHPPTLQNGASWGPGVVGPSALSLDGNQQYAAAAGPVIDTTQSFTVSAWVNLNNTNGYQTFVSQDGSQVSGVYLQLRGDSHHSRSRTSRTTRPAHWARWRPRARSSRSPASGTSSPASTTRRTARSRSMSTARSSRRRRSGAPGRRAARWRSGGAGSPATWSTSSPGGSTTCGCIPACSGRARSVSWQDRGG